MIREIAARLKRLHYKGGLNGSARKKMNSLPAVLWYGIYLQVETS